MRTASPGAAISRPAVTMRGSRRTSARAAARSTVRRPASHRVAGPKLIVRTGKLPISRRMDRLLDVPRLGVEEAGSRHSDGECLESLPDDAHAVGVVLLGPQARIAADMLDARAADPPVGARRHREGVDGRDNPHRDPDPLDLLGYLCAATIAGPSV